MRISRRARCAHQRHYSRLRYADQLKKVRTVLQGIIAVMRGPDARRHWQDPLVPSKQADSGGDWVDVQLMRLRYDQS